MPSQQLTTIDQTQATLHRWMPAHARIDVLQRRFLFRATPSQLTKIERTINPDIVLYLTLRMLGWLLGHQHTPFQVELSSAIKQAYRRLLMDSFFRRINMFELFVVIHVKITVLFVEEHFEDILVDADFEGKLCVILYHAILGVQVNEKIYEVLAGRYIQREIKPAGKLSTHTSFEKQAPEKRSVASIDQKSRKMLESKKNIDHSAHKSCKQLRFSRMSLFGRPQPKPNTESIGIEAVLKENLYVQPLPKLKKKRVKVHEFKRLMTEPQQEEPLHNNQLTWKPKVKYLFSNQLSSSIKAEYPEQLLFELNSKRVRLNQTFQNFERENMMVQKSSCKKKENKSFHGSSTETEVPIRGRMQAEEWEQLIHDLKGKVYHLKWQENGASDKYLSLGRRDGSVGSWRLGTEEVKEKNIL